MANVRVVEEKPPPVESTYAITGLTLQQCAILKGILAVSRWMGPGMAPLYALKDQLPGVVHQHVASITVDVHSGMLSVLGINK